jgi:hypothetical protein
MSPARSHMKERTFNLMLTASLLTAFVPTAFAHHSISAEFDGNRRVMLTGTVTKVSWGNPHTFFYVDVKETKSGSIVNWSCELGSPNMLATIGWTQNTLRVGMTVSFTGILARDGSHKVIARNIVADGNRVIAWPSEQTSP